MKERYFVSLCIQFVKVPLYIFFCYSPAGENLDVKKSSDKKLGKFLQRMQKNGYIKVKELSKGVESITEYDKDHLRLASASSFYWYLEFFFDSFNCYIFTNIIIFQCIKVWYYSYSAFINHFVICCPTYSARCYCLLLSNDSFVLFVHSLRGFQLPEVTVVKPDVDDNDRQNDVL